MTQDTDASPEALAQEIRDVSGPMAHKAPTAYHRYISVSEFTLRRWASQCDVFAARLAEAEAALKRTEENRDAATEDAQEEYVNAEAAEAKLDMMQRQRDDLASQLAKEAMRRGEVQAKLAAIVETTQWARSRLEKIADDAWHGDGRDFKRSLVGVFWDFDSEISDAPAPEVGVGDAARLLLTRWLDGAFEDGADAVADDAITAQWAHVDRTYPDAAPVIEAWLRALAGEGE